MFVLIHGHIEEDESILERRRKHFGHRFIELGRVRDPHPNVAVGLRKGYEVRQRVLVDASAMAPGVLHILPLPHHAEGLVIQVDDLHRQAVLAAGGELLDIHLDAAFPGDAGHHRIREGELHAHGRRQPVAHGAKPPRVHPSPGRIKPVILSGKHLVLTHV